MLAESLSTMICSWVWDLTATGFPSLLEQTQSWTCPKLKEQILGEETRFRKSIREAATQHIFWLVCSWSVFWRHYCEEYYFSSIARKSVWKKCYREGWQRRRLTLKVTAGRESEGTDGMVVLRRNKRWREILKQLIS